MEGLNQDAEEGRPNLIKKRRAPLLRTPYAAVRAVDAPETIQQARLVHYQSRNAKNATHGDSISQNVI